MNPDRWRQIEELFNSAVEVENPRRVAFLKERCADESIINEVLLLLEADGEATTLANPIDRAGTGIVNKTGLTAGSLIGQYQIEREIGCGGMGEVYLALDTALKRKVAIKVLPAYMKNDPERVRRFHHEARAASLLNHPNIVTIFESGTDGDLPYIVSEYIEGETLRALIERGHIAIDMILDIIIQTAEALAAAHDAGIAHRDIKPENIMVRTDGVVKVVDFGLAKLTEQPSFGFSSSLITTPGIVMGTVKYMSPEQARGQKLDVRTDIFSLGIVLYELLTGEQPFDGETNSDIIDKILSADPEPVRILVPQVPPRLEAIIKVALSKNREERYQTVTALAADLAKLRQP